jgi:glycosyltransferase involved in cell wall biosynthesis
MRLTYTVVIPAYNEALSIERAIRETARVFDSLERPFEIIVVDDGSADATAEMAKSLAEEFPAVRVLRHEVNCGKGTAVRTGVFASEGEWILFNDCDLATHPNEIHKFARRTADADVIIGSRRVKGADIARPQPFLRSLSGRAINWFIRHFLKLPYRDTQCGFKMFRCEAARRIFKDIGPARWTFDVELLLRARAAGLRIVELPVTWRAGDVSRVRIGEVLGDLKYLWKLKKRLAR